MRGSMGYISTIFFHSFFISTKFWQWGTASPYSFCLYIIVLFSFFLCLNLFPIFLPTKFIKQKVLLSFHYFYIIFLLHLTLFTSFNISTHIFSFSITLLFQHSYFSILPFHHFQHSFHLLSQSIIILSKHSHIFPFQNSHSLSLIFLVKTFF